MNQFLNKLLEMNLTRNEINLLLKLARKDLSRKDLLSFNDLQAPSLSKVIKSLSKKTPKIIDAKLKDGVITYFIIDNILPKIDIYGKYDKFIKLISCSTFLSLNDIKIILCLIINDNILSTASFLSSKLNIDADQLVSTVLYKLIMQGVIKTKFIEEKDSNIKFTEKDTFPKNLVYLNLDWGPELKYKFL